MFSKACEYAIRAIISIHRRAETGKHMNVAEVAEAIGSPTAYTSKILQQLNRADLLTSVKGAGGGYSVPPDRRITLIEIVKAIDGDRIFDDCALGLKACDALHPCPLHHQFVKVREELESMLTNSTVESLSSGVADGETVLYR